ncbi:unnamed protein product [Trichogramma brassicae]|uniref:Uncharacterized protein n=1 Tax=Trichogramma brassicae TaxID=86971 RepID=A0A6H5IKR0_9HYME|nr:unnamed protein product [Trichogramma brassicae]
MYKIDENSYIRYYSMLTPEYHDFLRRNFEENFVKLKAMRENVKWEIEEERREFLRQLYHLIQNWEGQTHFPLPNLRDIFRREEIDWLLKEEVKNGIRGTFIDFVIKTGYKDEPDLDEESSPHRTTAVHHSFGQSTYYYSGLVSKLFNIYNRFDINYTDELGLTHHHVACKHGLDDIVEKFLEHGQIDPNCLVPETGDSPLHLALEARSKKSVESLLRVGADPNSANKEGLTPLHIICKRHDDNVELFEMLFELSDEKYHPVQIDARDELGNTPLHLALNNGPKKIVELLLRRGADTNLANKEGLTPLYIICNRHDDNVELFEMLFELSNIKYQPVKINSQDKLGKTALHFQRFSSKTMLTI